MSSTSKGNKTVNDASLKNSFHSVARLPGRLLSATLGLPRRLSVEVKRSHTAQHNVAMDGFEVRSLMFSVQL